MTFNEWFGKQELTSGNIVEIAYKVAKDAWEYQQEHIDALAETIEEYEEKCKKHDI